MYSDWDTLKKECVNCEKCNLCKSRTNVVFGYGNPLAEVMLIGEAPGKDEDLKGEPFVGRSGKLLDAMLADIGLNRQTNIYIANIIKCRPPNNRDPLPKEQKMCIDWLRYQTALIHPKIIVAVGRISAQKIIDEKIKILKDHGKFYQKKDTIFMPTVHPAAILRNPKQKVLMEQDFINLKNKILEVCESTYN